MQADSLSSELLESPDSTYMRYLRVLKFTETESRMVVIRGWGKGEKEELAFKEYRVSVLEDLETDKDDGCTIQMLYVDFIKLYV